MKTDIELWRQCSNTTDAIIYLDQDIYMNHGKCQSNNNVLM